MLNPEEWSRSYIIFSHLSSDKICNSFAVFCILYFIFKYLVDLSLYLKQQIYREMVRYISADTRTLVENVHWLSSYCY